MTRLPSRPHGIADGPFAFLPVVRSHARCVATATVLLLASLATSSIGAEEHPIAAAIDRKIAAKLAEANVTPAPTVDDATFARRVTLDLAGRIPTTGELEAFVARTEPEKRAAYVDRLLASPDYAIHLRNELDALLLAELRRDDDWRKYLLEATQEDRAWDRIVREILLPERERTGEKGPAAFLRERVGDLDKVTNDASALLFGVNVSCAKCHDHPLVLDWQQDHYYGLASFFSRTYRTRAGSVAEKYDGTLKFTTVIGEEKQADFLFLTGATVQEPTVERTDERKKELDEEIKQAEREEDAPAPKFEFSPRAALVDLALSSDEAPMLARNIVNRTWARLIGRGLVEPLDQLHSDNPASHLELFDELTRSFVASGYDLKTLIRGIALSDVYARSCDLPTDAGEGVEPPDPALFAIGIARPLMPRQMATSLLIASTAPDRLPGLDLTPEWTDERRALDDRATGLSELFEFPGSSFQVGVEESLLFSNGDRIANDLLRSSDDRLVGSLKDLPDDEVVARAFVAVLSRPPSAEERDASIAYLIDRAERREEGLRQFVWALLATSEFRFNH